MEEIFRLEFHPVDGYPRRVRFLVDSGSNNIERVVEQRADSSWTRVRSEVIDYFQYSDE